jgi:hypothetical protein
MFYRVTRYEFPQERYDEILAWADTKADAIRAVDGLLSVDTFVSGPGEAMIVAAYDSEDDFNAASDTIMAILGEMGQFMSSAPMTSSGTVDWTSRT